MGSGHDSTGPFSGRNATQPRLSVSFIMRQFELTQIGLNIAIIYLMSTKYILKLLLIYSVFSSHSVLAVSSHMNSRANQCVGLFLKRPEINHSLTKTQINDLKNISQLPPKSSGLTLEVGSIVVNGVLKTVVLLGEAHKMDKETYEVGKKIISDFSVRGLEGVMRDTYQIGSAFKTILIVSSIIHFNKSRQSLIDLAKVTPTYQWLKNIEGTSPGQHTGTKYTKNFLLEFNHIATKGEKEFLSRSYLELIRRNEKIDFDPIKNARNSTMTSNIIEILNSSDQLFAKQMLVIVGKNHVPGIKALLAENGMTFLDQL